MNEQVDELSKKEPDSVYEFHYALVKDAVYYLYLWGLRTDNDDAIKFYKRMLHVFRTYDKKFINSEYKKLRSGDSQ